MRATITSGLIDKNFKEIPDFVRTVLKDDFDCEIACFDVEHDPNKKFKQKDFEFHGCSFGYVKPGSRSRNGPESAQIVYVQDPVTVFMLYKKFCSLDRDFIAYNGKYDLSCLQVVWDRMYSEDFPTPKKFVDPMIAVNLLDDNLRENQSGLKPTIKREFGVTMDTFLEASYAGLDSEDFLRYALHDNLWEMAIWEKLKPQLEEEGLDKLFRKILCEGSKTFAEMETHGLGWDIDYANELLFKIQDVRDELEVKLYDELGPINLNSGDQLAKIFFEDLEIPHHDVPMTESNKRLSVSRDTLEAIEHRHPALQKICNHRRCEKLRTTYVQPMTLEAIELESTLGQRIFGSFRLTSSTGRTRCAGFPLQTLTKRLPEMFGDHDLRRCVVAKEGWKLVIVDFSQLELRLAAHLTGDVGFIESFTHYHCKKCGCSGHSKRILHWCPNCGILEDEDLGFWHGADLHAKTATIPAVDSRDQAKIVNFATIYNAGAGRLNQELGVGKRKCQEIIDGFFKLYPDVFNQNQRLFAEIRAGLPVKDIFGRKRRITKQMVARSPKGSDNQAANFPAQASGAGIGVLAMNNVRRKWKEAGVYNKQARLLNFVHDEIVAEVRDDYVQQGAADVVLCMENAVQLSVPLRADCDIKQRWGKLKEDESPINFDINWKEHNIEDYKDPTSQRG